MNQKHYKKKGILLFFLFLFFFLTNISLGSVRIPIMEIVKSLLNLPIKNEAWQLIIIEYRLPKAIAAIFIGAGLAVSGLAMQSFFRNPLAGPYVLGVSSGASLGVAIVILGASTLGISMNLTTKLSYIFAAALGSLTVFTTLIIATTRLKNTYSILIIGLMFSSLTAAIISVLTYFSSANELQLFHFWSLGNLSNLTWNELGILGLVTLFGFFFFMRNIKPLNALLLGDNYAKSLGVNIKKTRLSILLTTCLFTGTITALAGPIAFVGLAVPHLIRLLIPSSDHKVLIPAVIFGGATFMLICDTLSQLPTSALTLPINATTSLIGAPVVIWLLFSKNAGRF